MALWIYIRPHPLGIPECPPGGCENEVLGLVLLEAPDLGGVYFVNEQGELLVHSDLHVDP